MQSESRSGASPFALLSDEAIAALETMPDCISIHKANGEVEWISTKASTILRDEQSAFAGRGFFENINPQDIAKILKGFSDCSINETEANIDFRKQVELEPGLMETRIFELRISPFTASEKSLCMGITRDVTDSRNALNIAEEQMCEAERLNSAKSLFLSTMSHELRTPLNAIIGFSQMLMGEASLIISEDKKIEYAGLINQSAEHLLHVLNDILDLSKIEAGKFQIIPETFDVTEELRSTVRLMEPVAQNVDVGLVCKFADEMPDITADPRAVKQIVMNLLSNAIKFSEAGSRVTLSLERVRRKVRISVRDTGIGMDAETVSNLGNVFYQAEQTASRRYEGAGLGLSIVFGLVQLHGGNVSFESEPDSGTCVHIELPIAVAETVPVPADPDKAIVYLNKTTDDFKSDEDRLITANRKTG